MSFRRLFVLALFFATTAAQADDGAKAVVTGDAKAGEAKSATCGACHGLDGNSPTAQYPKLAGQHEQYIARQITLFQKQKRESAVMMGFAMPLSEQDMHDIGAYFSGKQAIPGVADDKLMARGQALYRGGNNAAGVPACMACHGPDGRGNPIAGYPQLGGQHADYLATTLTNWHDGKTWGDDDHAKIMPMIAMRLSSDDIAAVSSYIEGLHNAAAGESGKTSSAK